MDYTLRSVSLDSSQEFSADEEDTSWTDSSYSSESFIALSTYPPRSDYAKIYKPGRTTRVTCLCDERALHGTLPCSCTYECMESNAQEESSHFHRGLLSKSVHHRRLSRHDYHYFPPYRDVRTGGLVDSISEKWNRVTSGFVRHFKRKSRILKNSEKTPLLAKRDAQNIKMGTETTLENSSIQLAKHSQTVYSRIDQDQSIQCEEEYRAPPRWRGADYLEWLGILRHPKTPGDCSSIVVSPLQETEGYSQGVESRSFEVSSGENRNRVEVHVEEKQIPQKPLVCLRGTNIHVLGI